MAMKAGSFLAMKASNLLALKASSLLAMKANNLFLCMAMKASNLLAMKASIFDPLSYGAACTRGEIFNKVRRHGTQVFLPCDLMQEISKDLLAFLRTGPK